MAMNVQDLEAEVLRLDPRERARLAERLLRSLEALSDEENETLWVEEAERREAEIDAGTARVRPAEEALQEARARLK